MKTSGQTSGWKKWVVNISTHSARAIPAGGKWVVNITTHSVRAILNTRPRLQEEFPEFRADGDHRRFHILKDLRKWSYSLLLGIPPPPNPTPTPPLPPPWWVRTGRWIDIATLGARGAFEVKFAFFSNSHIRIETDSLAIRIVLMYVNFEFPEYLR